MNGLPDNTPDSGSLQRQTRIRLTLLLCFHIVACCVSLIYVAEFYANYQIVMFDETHLYAAALNVAPSPWSRFFSRLADSASAMFWDFIFTP